MILSEIFTSLNIESCSKSCFRGRFQKGEVTFKSCPFGKVILQCSWDKFCRTCEACFFFLEILKAVVIMVNSETLKKELISRETGRVVA